MEEYLPELERELKGWDKGSLSPWDIARALSGGGEPTQKLPGKALFITLKDASAGEIAYATFMRAGISRLQKIYIACTAETHKEILEKHKLLQSQGSNITFVIVNGLI